MDNSAFEDIGEISRILKNISDNVGNFYVELDSIDHVIKDINGNNVGKFTIK